MFVVIDLVLIVGVLTSISSYFLARRSLGRSPLIRGSMWLLWGALTAFLLGTLLTSQLVIGLLTVEEQVIDLVGFNLFGGSYSKSVP